MNTRIFTGIMHAASVPLTSGASTETPGLSEDLSRHPNHLASAAYGLPYFDIVIRSTDEQNSIRPLLG